MVRRNHGTSSTNSGWAHFSAGNAETGKASITIDPSEEAAFGFDIAPKPAATAKLAVGDRVTVEGYVAIGIFFF